MSHCVVEVVLVRSNRVEVPVGPRGLAGPPGADGNAAGAFNYTQASPLSSWTINHNKGYRPHTEVYSPGGVRVGADVTHTSVNQTIVSFSAPQAGFARLI